MQVHIEHLEKCLDLWAEALAEKEFFGGKKPNAADLAIYGILHSIEEMPAFVFVESNPKVTQWYEALTCLISSAESKAA